MPAIDPDSLHGDPLSYARPRRETPGEIIWNRISVTTGLFATAMVSAVLLGRRR